MSMIHDITPKAPRNKRGIRKGRGRASGRGKTAGRGGKGSTARQGSPHWKPGHEGGQTPLFRRVPKRGFSNFNFQTKYHVVNLEDLDRFDEGSTVDAAALIEAGLVPDDRQPVKVLGNGAIGKRLTVVAGWYSKSAHEKITQAGGAAQNARGEAFVFPKPKFKKKWVPKSQQGPQGQPGGGGKKKDKGAAGGEAPAGEQGPAAAAPATAEGGAAPSEAAGQAE